MELTNSKTGGKVGIKDHERVLSIDVPEVASVGRHCME